MYNKLMRAITVSEFRQQCLSLMDHLPAEGLLITRHGHPIAKLFPAEDLCADLLSSIPGLVCDKNDDLFSTGAEWDAQS